MLIFLPPPVQKIGAWLGGFVTNDSIRGIKISFLAGKKLGACTHEPQDLDSKALKQF